MFTVLEEDKIFASLEAGASGYLLTPPPMKYRGHQGCDFGWRAHAPGIARRVLERFKKPPVAHRHGFHLSKRETEILTLLVKGYASSASLPSVSFR